MSRSAPPLLPVLRSRQLGEVLAWILDDTEREVSVSELSRILRIPQPTVHRDVQRCFEAGVLRARNVGRTRLISANPGSVYLGPLRELMVRSFGAPHRIAGALGGVAGVEAAFIYGSSAARFVGVPGTRAVADIDLLVLGQPDEEALYRAVEEVMATVGYDIQVTVRPAGWLEEGTGSFHDTVVSRPMVEVTPDGYQATIAPAAATASDAHR